MAYYKHFSLSSVKGLRHRSLADLGFLDRWCH
jgi:hypothetical protein